MGKYEVISVACIAPQKVVIYGPEGIGKSTFASFFPEPLFIDTEGGTKKLSIRRLPQPNSWAMLLDEVDTVRRGELKCGTLVIDTADWAERLCIRAVCAKSKVSGIEDFGYGKGYTYLKEEFGRLLDQLQDVVDGGINVVITAHAQISKFEQPDEMGQYDRWSMKTSKQAAPLLREWCDMLLFANYRTYVIKDGDGKNAKAKAQGGERVMYTTHHACWDAKNRDGLPDMPPFDYSGIAKYIPSDSTSKARENTPQTDAPRKFAPAAQAAEQQNQGDAPAKNWAEDVPSELRSLMISAGVTYEQIQKAVFLRGCYPQDMPIGQYDAQFVSGSLVASWSKWMEFINANCRPDSSFEEVTGMDKSDLPF